MAVCKACNAPMIWARNEIPGRPPIPLDAVPKIGGRYYIDNGTAREAKNAPPGANTFDTHFISCPEAPRFRKRKRTRR